MTMAGWPNLALVQIGATRPPAATTPTLAELVPPFLGWLRFVRLRSENTVIGYRYDLASFVGFCRGLELVAPADVTFKTVEMYMASLQHHRGCTAATANRHKCAIGEFFKYL